MNPVSLGSTGGRRRRADGFLRWIELDREGLALDGVDLGRYPFNLPVVAGLRAAGRLHLNVF